MRLTHPLMPYITEAILQRAKTPAGPEGETIMLHYYPVPSTQHPAPSTQHPASTISMKKRRQLSPGRKPVNQ
ncbi:hypothetical protein [Microbulbifer sp. THAF38]|uniref:hypothetical protein n=1 Tax=Microbulbifer sp. THAF38 TaxID=2587856 RepID=UPI0012695EA9|nr:hypothetical protein [Microbulbifer sp. THAF38]